MTTTTRRPTIPAAPDWTSALCAQTDPDLFFPEGHGQQIVQAVNQAKKLCADCPLRSGCLEWAVTTGQTIGVWGGLSEQELRNLHRRQILASRNTTNAHEATAVNAA
ncbi:WhiB family transcriptional regulator (plasmid) [Streptomyces seoulensis]|nr:WhiB family transcriptional regulator [Streptomyces seoulensis]